MNIRRKPNATRDRVVRKTPARTALSPGVFVRAQAEQAITQAKRAHNRLREAIDLLPQGVVFLDEEGRYILWNKRYADFYEGSADLFQEGVKLEDTLRIGVARGQYPEAEGREEEWLAERLDRLKNPRGAHEQRTADGRCILIEERRTSEGGIIGLRLDITEMKQREASIRLLFDANPMPMCVVSAPAGRILAVNEAAVAHYGYARADFLRMTLDDLHRAEDAENLCELIGGHLEEHTGRTWKQTTSDGRTIDVAIYAQPLPYDGEAGVMMAMLDITERKKAEARIAFMAHHDALTRLPNRVLFRERMETALAQLERSDQQVAVLCVDLDHFKTVNDSLGHPVGDMLLREVGNRLREALRDTDTVARLGGDEFALVQTNLRAAEDAGTLAHRLLDILRAPYDLDGHLVTIGASIGIAVAPFDGADADKLLKNADMALYRAKDDGRNTVRFFEAEMDARAQARRRTELELRLAIAEGRLEVHYQPLVDLGSGRVAGFEALLRWNHAERGAISPAEFVPIAEETGLIGALGSFVLNRACHDAAAWPDDVKIAVNLSPLQFRTGNLVDLVLAALKDSRLAPQRLELEITETLLLDRSEQVLKTLHALRKIGVRISMDDFGTGYSSLAYLRSFPFDKIKIDRSFVRDLGQNPDSQAIVRAIVGLGSSLGITITAEGVERAEDLELLRAEGCNQGQGFLFSKAAPASDVPLLIEFCADASAAI